MLRNGTVEREPTLEDQHFLLGYRWNTLLSYSTGIRKYLKFANESARQPGYLSTYPSPHETFMLSATGQEGMQNHLPATTLPQTPCLTKEEGCGLGNTLRNSRLLSEHVRRREGDRGLSYCCLLGMARISELTSKSKSGTLRKETALLTSDVTFYTSDRVSCASLAIRSAKTSAPGEIQAIYLRLLQNILCPVQGVQRRLAEARGTETSLFGH
ncbi:hypothetical protein PSTG_01657 [Puccinia striiformis f. sp. tritici PST-78]|uniref:Uncharacterized protein n=1 Tax=Puccinia striiformis f. sp. tritici PST-78 TaxID=1165861 RepID=A0A0L0W0I6_9BASI|nr:hypothetical protein PSTG_01657 [Puccinia striiformis f. sp. tritici PST-78]